MDQQDKTQAAPLGGAATPPAATGVTPPPASTPQPTDTGTTPPPPPPSTGPSDVSDIKLPGEQPTDKTQAAPLGGAATPPVGGPTLAEEKPEDKPAI